MGISKQDQELWQLMMRDTLPLNTPHVIAPPPRLAKRQSTVDNPHHHTWDLHGMTLGEGYQFSLDKIHDQQGNYKFVTFITGKSGQMNQEFVHWLDQNPHVRKVEPTNNGGAYKVWFRKTRQKNK